MGWPDIRKYLPSFKALGGGNDAPMNLPIVDLEERSDFLFSRVAAFRSFAFGAGTGASVANLSVVQSVGEWADLINSGSGKVQPIESGRSYGAFLSAEMKKTSTSANLAGALYVGSGNVYARGRRFSTTPGDWFPVNGSGIFFPSGFPPDPLGVTAELANDEYQNGQLTLIRFGGL